MTPRADRHDIRRTSTRCVAEAMLKYWAAQDVAQTIALHHHDAVSCVHLDRAGPMSGEVRGRDAIEAGLYGNLATWFYLSFEPEIIAIAGDTARVQVAFDYQHQRSGLRFAGSMRWVIVVTDGLVSRVDCYHDAAKVDAFKRLLASEGHTL